jgi:hypothetical protein
MLDSCVSESSIMADLLFSSFDAASCEDSSWAAISSWSADITLGRTSKLKEA